MNLIQERPAIASEWKREYHAIYEESPRWKCIITSHDKNTVILAYAKGIQKGSLKEHEFYFP